METTVHSLIAAQFVQDRIAEATSARAAQEFKRRRLWRRNGSAAERGRLVTAPRVTASST